MREWWQGRNPAERRTLVLGALVVVGAAWFLGVVEPLLVGRGQQANRLAAERALAAHLTTVAAEVTSRGGAGVQAPGAGETGRSLLAVVTATARAQGIEARTRRMNPVGPRALALYLEDVPFTDLAAWLLTLDGEHGIVVERVHLDAGRATGVVNAELTLAGQ